MDVELFQHCFDDFFVCQSKLVDLRHSGAHFPGCRTQGPKNDLLIGYQSHHEAARQAYEHGWCFALRESSPIAPTDGDTDGAHDELVQTYAFSLRRDRRSCVKAARHPQ